MARKNVPLTISRPGEQEALNIVFVDYVTEDGFVIPYRYPFDDIENYTALKTAGYFRHDTKEVSTELGGSASEDTFTNLGFELPNTEKLILLVKVKTIIGAEDVVITIAGSDEYNIDDVELTIPATSAVGEVFEIDLYDFGLLISGTTREVFISADSDTADDEEHLQFALIARMG